METRTLLAAAAATVLAVGTAQADSLDIQSFDYFSTDGGFSDGDISVFDGKARWEGVTDSTGATTHTGTFGDGTVLDYQFVGTDRSSGVMETKAAGTSTIISNDFTVGTYGTSGGGNTGLDVWTSDPDDTGTWDTTPESDAWGTDHVTGGDQLRGVIDVSGLASAQIYFIYGSYKNAATVQLGTTAGGNDLGTLSLSSNGPDNDRLVIQEVTIDNTDSTYGEIHFNYSAQGNAGRGRFSGVVVDGVVPEPGSLALLGLGGLLIAHRRRG